MSTTCPIRFASGVGALNLFMRHVGSGDSRREPPILILHGATFPSGSAAAWKIDGVSWMDDLAAHGYEVYALDFLGYGESDRYPEMYSEDAAGPALGEMQSMLRQIDRAVGVLSTRHPGRPVHLIAHSAGTLPAARYAELHPARVERLVLFGAPAPRADDHAREPGNVRYLQVTSDHQFNAFEPRVRESGAMNGAMFAAWAAAYLATDSSSDARRPASVRVPAGMLAGLDEVRRLGRLPFDPGRIVTPTLTIQGEWDCVTPPAEGLWLFEHLAAPLKRCVFLSQGGHRLHLERSRLQLYQEVRGFLDAFREF